MKGLNTEIYLKEFGYTFDSAGCRNIFVKILMYFRVTLKGSNSSVAQPIAEYPAPPVFGLT
jgi:hypothetical protein